MNLFSSDDEQASSDMHMDCSSPKENSIEQRWIAIVSELVIVLVSDEQEIISALKPQTTSSELDRTV